MRRAGSSSASFGALVALVVVATGASLLAWSWYESRTQRRELEKTLRSEGGALVEALGHAVENALASSREVDEISTGRLLDVARLIARLDAARPLDTTRLEALVDDLALHSIFVLDRGLRVVAEAHLGSDGEGPATPAFDRAPLKDLARGAADEAVLPGVPLAAAVRLSRGGVLLVESPVEESLSFLESTGVDHLVDAVSEAGGVEYLVIEDDRGAPIARAGAPGPGTGPPSLEFQHPVELAAGRNGRIRIGLSGEPLAAAARASRRRVAAATMVALSAVIGLGVVSLLRRRAAALRSEIAAVRSITHAILEGMEEAVLVLGNDGVLRHMNPAAARLFGARPAEMIGRPCASTPCALIEEEIRAGAGPREIVLPREKGPPRLVLVSASEVRDDDGRVEGTALLMRDVTDLRHLEKEARRGDELAAFGRLASAVAHEVRNPLNAISVAVQRWWNEHPPARPGEEHTRLVRLLREEILRLDGIVADFLALARPPSVTPVPGDLDARLRETAPLLAQGAPEGVRFTVETGGLPLVCFDQAALSQLLHNLVNNAIEAVGSRGTVRIATRLAEGRAVLEITDDGPGIPPGDLDRVFELGFTTKPAGNGMGLPIVHRLVYRMGGTIAVESTPGGGTTVRVTLPLARAAEV